MDRPTYGDSGFARWGGSAGILGGLLFIFVFVFVGAVVGPLLTGFLAEQDLFTAAWIACATLALLAAGMIVATLRGEARTAGPL